MGKTDQKKGSKTLATTVGADGNVNFDAIVKQGNNKTKFIASDHNAMVPKLDKLKDTVSCSSMPVLVMSCVHSCPGLLCWAPSFFLNFATSAFHLCSWSGLDRGDRGHPDEPARRNFGTGNDVLYADAHPACFCSWSGQTRRRWRPP